MTKFDQSILDPAGVLTGAEFTILVNAKVGGSTEARARIGDLRRDLHGRGIGWCPECARAGHRAVYEQSAMRPVDKRQGYSRRCRSCDNARCYANDLAHPARRLLHHARDRARDRNQPFTINEAFVQRLVDDAAFEGQPFGACPVFGLSMTYMNDGARSGEQPETSVTLDCIVDAVGYVPDNVVLLSRKANRAKSNVGVERLIKLAAALSVDGPPAQVNEVFGDHIDRVVCRRLPDGTPERRGWRREAFNSAKSRASVKGRDFALELPDIKAPKACPCCGVTLNYPRQMRGGKKGAKPNSPSLDRFDSERGYTPDNVWTVCQSCNRAMSTLDRDELFVLAEWCSIELTERGHLAPFAGSTMYVAEFGEREWAPSRPPPSAEYVAAALAKNKPSRIDADVVV